MPIKTGIAATIALASGAYLACNVSAASISFTKVADTDTALPSSSTATYTNLLAPSIDGTNIAFMDNISNNNNAIYSRINGNIIQIANGNTLIPSVGTPTGVSFDRYSSPVISGSSVGFWGRNAVEFVAGEFVWTNGGGITAVADQDTTIPSESKVFWANDFSAPAFDGGALVFSGTDGTGVSQTQQGVYTNLGGSLTKVADLNTLIPDGTGAFTSFSNAPSGIGTVRSNRYDTDGNDVVFRGAGDDGQFGFYVWSDGSFTTVVNQDTLYPGSSTNRFKDINSVSIDDGVVVFDARELIGTSASGNRAVIIKDADGLSLVADSSTKRPDGSNRNFSQFGSLALDSGNVAFMHIGGGALDPDGLFVSIDGSITKIIDIDDVIDGKGVRTLSFAPDGLSGNRVAFSVGFDDFTSSAIYVAEIATDNVIGIDPIFGAKLTTGSPVSISQNVSTPDTAFDLTFDYLFETATGTLTVMLDGQEIATIDAPSEGQSSPINKSIEVDGSLLNLSDVTLSFELDGPTGSSALISDIVFPGLSNGDFANGSLLSWGFSVSGEGSVGTSVVVPEPTVAAMLLIVSMGVLRRRNGFRDRG